MKIKFRVWDKKKACFRHTENIINHNGELFISEHLQPPYYLERDQDNFLIQLWTGRLDIHGKEIYDGDIIKGVKYENYFGAKSTPIISAVQLSLATNIDPYSGGGPDGWTEFQNIEIIGNICENPELL